jgi:hypothetical protein
VACLTQRQEDPNYKGPFRLTPHLEKQKKEEASNSYQTPLLDLNIIQLTLPQEILLPRPDPFGKLLCKSKAQNESFSYS